MEKNETILSGEESLKIISDMINKTKTDIQQSSFHLLFWGWLILFCSVSEYLLFKFSDFASPWYVWLFVIPGVFISMIYGFVKGRRQTVFTYATSVYVFAWVAFLVSSVILYLVVRNTIDIFSPLILTLAAIPTLISGVILRFRPLVYGAISFWVFALVANYGGPDISALAVPAAMLTGYLIPGYILKRKNDHGKV
jgi:hypothetical protein